MDFRRLLAASTLMLLAAPGQAQYQQPPEPLLVVMRAPLLPQPQLDPTGTTLLLVSNFISSKLSDTKVI